jgi:dipeptidyl aminopeptidase/acylaminoacyl peptidase
VDTTTGAKTELTPRDAKEKIFYGDAQFSKDGKGVYVTSDKDSEFQRLSYFDLATKQPKFLTSKVPWDVQQFDLTQDGRRIAFVTDEEGVSVLHVMDTAAEKEVPLPKLPVGVIGALRWHKNGRELGFSLNNARSPGDCYSLDVTTGKVERWTMSETAVKTDTFPGSGTRALEEFRRKNDLWILYKPAAKFSGKRPVLVVIHGGPDGQSQPTFLGPTIPLESALMKNARVTPSESALPKHKT